MKKPPSEMCSTRWVIGGLLAAYVIGDVILYFDLVLGGVNVDRLPESIRECVFTIYTPAFLFLSMIWPKHFPFFYTPAFLFLSMIWPKHFPFFYAPAFLFLSIVWPALFPFYS